MAIERNNLAEQQIRLDHMIAEFRAARQRRLVKQGVGLWNRAEIAHRERGVADVVPPAKIN